jgi:hypothetical protein
MMNDFQRWRREVPLYCTVVGESNADVMLLIMMMLMMMMGNARQWSPRSRLPGGQGDNDRPSVFVLDVVNSSLDWTGLDWAGLGGQAEEYEKRGYR